MTIAARLNSSSIQKSSYQLCPCSSVRCGLLTQFFKIALYFQCFVDSFCKTPGWGYSPKYRLCFYRLTDSCTFRAAFSFQRLVDSLQKSLEIAQFAAFRV